jgi:hypothetical protein
MPVLKQALASNTLKINAKCDLSIAKPAVLLEIFKKKL